MNNTFYIAFLFFSLLLLQVLVLNNILFLGYVNPYLYISFVFLYPLQQNRFNILFISFLLGLSIDVFSNSGGIHAFSLVFIAYIRLFFINSIFKNPSLDYKFFNFSQEPFGKVFNYIITLTLIHHFILFSLANFSFQNFYYVILNTLLSGFFTVALFFLLYYIFSPKQLKK